MHMIQEYSEYLRIAASYSQDFGKTFRGIQFDEHTQAIEVFVLQALSMCSSHCRAAALLLENDFLGESAAVLRSIQELLFDIYWILQPKDREERLERVYQLEADPYTRWDKEADLVAKQYSSTFASKMRVPLDEIARKYPFLIVTNPDGSKSFKKAPPFAARMGVGLRARHYHIYCYSSLFTHPTPMIKSLYLNTSQSDDKGIDTFEESHRQLVAYSLSFIQLILGYAEQTIGSFAVSARTERDDIFRNMTELVERANKGYFRNPLANDSMHERPS